MKQRHGHTCGTWNAAHEFSLLTRVMNISIQYLHTYEYFVIYEIVKQSTGTCNFPHVDTERNQDGVEFGEALKYRFPILS